MLLHLCLFTSHSARLVPETPSVLAIANAARANRGRRENAQSC
jgi:hypothetical protein